ncbi:MAG: response regulator transcription factor [Solirubrobacteraceae bacterium]
MARLLLVEDDATIAEPLTRALTREGHEVSAVGDGETALERVRSAGPFDLVLLDVGLPGIDGIETCRRLRARTPEIGVLMLTARAEEVDEVLGLNAGADDYVTKPFSLAVLVARVGALARREPARPTTAAGGVRVDARARRAWLGERELELTPKEFDLLALLVARAGSVVRREEIMTEVWDTNWFGSTKTLDMHISWLRRKLGDSAAEPSLLHTVRGVGFRFEAP